MTDRVDCATLEETIFELRERLEQLTRRVEQLELERQKRSTPVRSYHVPTIKKNAQGVITYCPPNIPVIKVGRVASGHFYLVIKGEEEIQWATERVASFWHQRLMYIDEA